MGSPDTAPGFLARIDRSGQCWRWPGVWQANDYPLVKFQGRQSLVTGTDLGEFPSPSSQGREDDASRRRHPPRFLLWRT
jgi:hypothetical protein